MAEARGNTQILFTKSVLQAEAEAFKEGLAAGRRQVQVARRRVSAWAEEHPGQMLIAGLLAGFVMGKLIFRPQAEDLDD